MIRAQLYDSGNMLVSKMFLKQLIPFISNLTIGYSQLPKPQKCTQGNDALIPWHYCRFDLRFVFDGIAVYRELNQIIPQAVILNNKAMVYGKLENMDNQYGMD
jgi:hypothetical protein